MARFEIKSGMTDQGPWVLDLGVLTIDEGIELQKLTGLGPRQWVDALTEDDPLAVRFAFYLARKRVGEEVRFAEVTVNLFGMELTILPEDDEQSGAEVPEDVAGVVPTGPPISDEVTI